ncbi:helix-turn-helix domain-containing protein [Prauserella cavernicola]|uniref:MerR family transcriptional regulator n=1 Tax=Prauserella cavernicola TaxID=2800127 RepID=A0A934QZF3_9PSEU|nr:MerR family transcriptional regulator [Prauserella cavernicola]MBK1789391.1 MerR family transcriptional regulator [Prauserella cavernicola]
MGWSTRQIAELAGTSLRTVRHYHEVGLLAEPERRANGYKQYGVAHLIRVLRIKRLTDLGFSLSQIAAMGEADEHPREALRTLDAELAATIERLQRARVELTMLLRQATPTDLPLELAPAATNADLSEADRSLVVVLTRVLGPSGLDTYRGVLQAAQWQPDTTDFENLPADADEHTRDDLAARLSSQVGDLFAEHPGLGGISADAPGGANHAAKTINTAVQDLYNPAQIDVIRRAIDLARATPRP